MPALPLSPLKILYMEDDANSRRLVERLLQAEGCDVYLAADGLAGLELARQIQPALVLTDVGFSVRQPYWFQRRPRPGRDARHRARAWRTHLG
jgi:CheY-like chemotaxis protein